ncbi:FAD-dependent oxidoreductase, partial [Streptomyces xantholiticus]
MAGSERRQRGGEGPAMGYVARIVIIGGGPGGYEAALVAAQLGAEVTVVDCDG